MRTNVLLVEDNPSDVYLWKELFRETSNVPIVHWVKDGTEALAYVRQSHEYQNAMPPDVILLDLNMPRLDGYQLLQLLKTESKTAHIPVIVLTTSHDPVDMEQCAGMGATMFLTKPSGLADCKTLVSQLVEQEFPRLVKG